MPPLTRYSVTPVNAIDARTPDWWREPMPEATARRVLGSERFDRAVARGAGHCQARARGAWDANLPESFGAYRTAERLAEGGAE